MDFEKLIASAEQAQAKIADLEPCLQAPELRPAVAPPLATPPPAWLRCEVQELQEVLQCTRGIITEGDDKKQDEHPGSVTKFARTSSWIKDDRSWIKAGSGAAADAAEPDE